MNDNSWWQLLVKAIRWLISWLVSLVSPKNNITFDTGRKVAVGRQIAEGGFSYVFEATDEAGRRYALKRIPLGDSETLRQCQKEAGLHRSVRHPNLMPLLGMKVEEKVCYMLFPFLQHSLRNEVNARFFPTNAAHAPRPWLEVRALELFYGILQGIHHLHTQAHSSHCDVKLENILLDGSNTPVIMDFGSAGPLEEPIETRRQVLELVEQASMHTTLPYRPPELLEGGVRAGDVSVDFTAVDVWSLGCTFFALLFGASPFECEFPRGNIRIVDCTPLRIIGNLPTLPSEMQQWYSTDCCQLYKDMLTQDRMKRPSLQSIMDRVEKMIQQQGGRLPATMHSTYDDSDDDMNALLGNRGFV